MSAIACAIGFDPDRSGRAAASGGLVPNTPLGTRAATSGMIFLVFVRGYGGACWPKARKRRRKRKIKRKRERWEAGTSRLLERRVTPIG